MASPGNFELLRFDGGLVLGMLCIRPTSNDQEPLRLYGIVHVEKVLKGGCSWLLVLISSIC